MAVASGAVIDVVVVGDEVVEVVVVVGVAAVVHDVVESGEYLKNRRKSFTLN